MSSETKGAAGLSGRYATAIFRLAEEAGMLDGVAGDMKSLSSMIAASPDLARVVASPTIPRDEQGRAMAMIAEKSGFSDLTRRFLGVVTANRRLAALPAIISSFDALLAEKRGESLAEVVSARPLTPEQMDALKASLGKAVGSGVAIDSRVDPSLIGGLVVRVGSRMVDSSLRTKVRQLGLAMKGIG